MAQDATPQPAIEELDASLVASHVRITRMILGYSQEDVARLSGLGVRTVRRVERGVPTSRRTLLKICKGLDVTLHQLSVTQKDVVGRHVAHGVHRRAESVWYYPKNVARPKVPLDEAERIQNADERMRLGKLGLVPMFTSSTGFIMPEGPGMIQIEMFGRFEGTFNAEIYRKSLIVGVRGRIRIGLEERTVELGEGDVLGYDTGDMRWMQPAEGEDLPVSVLWIGAVRVGGIPHEGQRIKRRTALPGD